MACDTARKRRLLSSFFVFVYVLVSIFRVDEWKLGILSADVVKFYNNFVVLFFLVSWLDEHTKILFLRSGSDCVNQRQQPPICFSYREVQFLSYWNPYSMQYYMVGTSFVLIYAYSMQRFFSKNKLQMQFFLQQHQISVWVHS